MIIETITRIEKTHTTTHIKSQKNPKMTSCGFRIRGESYNWKHTDDMINCKKCAKHFDEIINAELKNAWEESV